VRKSYYSEASVKNAPSARASGDLVDDEEMFG